MEPRMPASPMLPHVHDHIGRELHQVARTDTVFIVVAVAFNLVVLAINAAVAGGIGSGAGLGAHLVFWVLIIGTVTITVTSIRALSASSATRGALVAGLARLYADEGVDRYYDGGIARNYAVRYSVFSVVLGVLGALAVLVPLATYLFT